MKKSHARIDEITVTISREEIESMVKQRLMRTEALKGLGVDRVKLNFDFLNQHGASSGPITGLEVRFALRQTSQHPTDI